MAEAPEVKVKLSAEDQGVSAAIKELGLQLKNLKTQQDETATSGFNLSRAFQAIAASAVLIKLEEVGKSAFDAAVSIGKMSEKTGVGTEAMSVFYHVAEEMGVSTEAVDRGLTKAARTITLFEQGSKAAAAGFQLLGLKQKELIGLNADQKMALVVERLGAMPEGFQKATAAQEIFSKGGAEMILVADKVASEGFGNITKALKDLGLLLDPETIEKFRKTKEQMQELADAGKGLATQFEIGFIPALNDVAKAVFASTSGAAGGFEDFGTLAGEVLRRIVNGILLFGISVHAIVQECEADFDQFWGELRDTGGATFKALGQIARADLVGAAETLKAGIVGLKKDEEDHAKAVVDIWNKAAFDIKLKQDALFAGEGEQHTGAPRKPHPDTSTPPPLPTGEKVDPAVLAEIKRQKELDALAKDHAALLHAQLQGELDIWKAYEKQREEAEKDSYDLGDITTAAYYAKRQADLKTETERELAILRQELVAAQQEAARASFEQTKFEGEAKQRGSETKTGQALQTEADRASQERATALVKIDELQTKIATTTINGDTQALALERERDKAQTEGQQKVLEFQKQIALLQGKELEVSQADIAIEAEKYRTSLEQAGQTKEQIDAEIADFTRLKTAQAEFAAAEKREANDQKQFEIEKRGIEIQAKTGLISQSQAQSEINNLIKQRLPLLLQDAQAELRIAQASGNKADIAKAQQTIQALQNLGITADRIGVKVKTALEGDFQSFFSSLTSGTIKASKAFQEFGLAVVSSLEQIAAQWLIAAAEKKIADALGLAGDLTKKAATIATNDALIVSDAGVAGAAGFASAMLALPFPVNVAVAPGVMAAAIATTLGNLALGSAEQGALLNEDTFLQAHAQEMVLPADISKGLQFAINTGSFQPPSAELLSAPLSRGAGDLHQRNEFNLHHNGPDAREVLEKELVPRIETALRRGRLKGL